MDWRYIRGIYPLYWIVQNSQEMSVATGRVSVSGPHVHLEAAIEQSRIETDEHSRWFGIIKKTWNSIAVVK